MRFVRIFCGILIVAVLFTLPVQAVQKRAVFLGDSLTSGYGLQSGEDIVSQLQRALRAEGLDIRFDNAGVSGDTSAGGLARLDWSIAGDPKPSLVVVALGANDMLRGIDPATTRKNLTAIMDKLKAQEIPVFLIGMKSSLNMGPKYRKEFDVIYDDLAKKYDVPYYPFFLEGVAMQPHLNLEDGVHPNKEGIAVMVKNIAPLIKAAMQE